MLLDLGEYHNIVAKVGSDGPRTRKPVRPGMVTKYREDNQVVDFREPVKTQVDGRGVLVTVNPETRFAVVFFNQKHCQEVYPGCPVEMFRCEPIPDGVKPEVAQHFGLPEAAVEIAGPLATAVEGDGFEVTRINRVHQRANESYFLGKTGVHIILQIRPTSLSVNC